MRLAQTHLPSPDSWLGLFCLGDKSASPGLATPSQQCHLQRIGQEKVWEAQTKTPAPISTGEELCHP